MLCPLHKGLLERAGIAKARAAPIAAVLPVRSRPPRQSRRPPRDMAAAALITLKRVRALKLCARSKVAEAQNWPWARWAIGAAAAVPPCNHPPSPPYDMYGAPDVGADFKK